MICLGASPRCIARSKGCCTPFHKCASGEGYCQNDNECQSGLCGALGSSCNVEVHGNASLSQRCCAEGGKCWQQQN